MINKKLFAFALCFVALGSAFKAQAESKIPFQIIESMYGGGWLMAPCEINGLQKECKIDTGVNVSSIRESADTINFASLAKRRYFSASGKSVTCDLVQVPSLNLGSISKSSFEAVRCPVVDVRTEINIIGLDYFAGTNLLIDYRRQEITFSPDQKDFSLQSWDPDSVDHILVPVKAGHKYQPNVPTIAMLDTGASMTVVSKEFAQKNSRYFTLISEFDQGSDTHGHKLTAKLMLMSGITIGELVVAGEYVMAIDFKGIKKFAGEKVDFIIGHNMLKNANWYFDLVDRKWAVVPF